MIAQCTAQLHIHASRLWLQKFGPDGYSLLHRATWRPGEAAVDALVYLLNFLDVDTRAVRTNSVSHLQPLPSHFAGDRADLRPILLHEPQTSSGLFRCSQVSAVPARTTKKNKKAGIRQSASPGATPLMEAAARGQVRALLSSMLDGASDPLNCSISPT